MKLVIIIETNNNIAPRRNNLIWTFSTPLDFLNLITKLRNPAPSNKNVCRPINGIPTPGTGSIFDPNIITSRKMKGVWVRGISHAEKIKISQNMYRFNFI